MFSAVKFEKLSVPYKQYLNMSSSVWLKVPRHVLFTKIARTFGSNVYTSTKNKTHTPEPEFEYLCDPKFTGEIRDNIKRRKHVGDIDRVLDLYGQYQLDDQSQNESSRTALLEEALKIPNRCHPRVKNLVDPHEREVVGTRPTFNFKPRQFHVLAESLDGLRTKNLGIVTGPRSYYLKGALARLETALVRYTLHHLLRHKLGFRVVSVPDLLPSSVIEGCGMSVKGKRTQVYSLHPQHYGDVCLSGTAEMALAGMYRNKTIHGLSAPLCFAAVSRCFRAETSSIKEEAGIYRVHQFTKVEMFGFTRSDEGTEGDKLLEDFVDFQKTLFADLGLHFKILDMPAHELGAPAYRKYDVEAWMPGRQLFGEISSSSNCTDYQTRRLGIRYRSQVGKGLQFPYTVNGTACAVPRMLIALLETHQQKDRSVVIPPALRPFMKGDELLKPVVKVNMQYTRTLPEITTTPTY